MRSWHGDMVHFGMNIFYLKCYISMLFHVHIKNIESMLLIMSYPEDLVVVGLFIYGFLIFSNLDSKCSEKIPIPYYFMLLLLIIQLSTWLKYISWLLLVWMWLPIAVYVVYIHSRERETMNNESSWEQFELQVFNNLAQKLITSQIDSQYDAWSIWLIEFTQGDRVITLPWNERHFFHKEWIRQWLHRKRTCPLWSQRVEYIFKFELSSILIT